MKLLVISHTPHALEAGEWKGWSATVRELSAVAGLFDELVHVAPVVDRADAGMCAYSASNVRGAGVKPSGGEGLAAKAGILAAWLEYSRSCGGGGVGYG